jgi:hypothetical protein
MRSAFSAVTVTFRFPAPFSTALTAIADTPALSATSRMVALMISFTGK